MINCLTSRCTTPLPTERNGTDPPFLFCSWGGSQQTLRSEIKARNNEPKFSFKISLLKNSGRLLQVAGVHPWFSYQSFGVELIGFFDWRRGSPFEGSGISSTVWSARDLKLCGFLVLWNGEFGGDFETSRWHLPASETENGCQTCREADPAGVSLGILLHHVA